MAADPQAALEALRQRFLRRAAGDLDLLVRYAAGEASVEDVRFAVHRLNGAAGSFGYPEVSTAASWVETDWPAGGGPDPERLETLISALRALPAPDEPTS
jgi:HPt (histidine-containing phosphotransfer) domain-containing protein